MSEERRKETIKLIVAEFRERLVALMEQTERETPDDAETHTAILEALAEFADEGSGEWAGSILTMSATPDRQADEDEMDDHRPSG